MNKYYCYILSNKNKTVLYIGYTDNLKRRLKEHLEGNGALFTKKYKVTDLMYFEEFNEMKNARLRERQLKKWHKKWKWNLIKESNPYLITIEIN
ncbi:GIY-YIG nuclease family protein [Hyunsoonleella sp. 2307UL5-6]|uniref:GIY-YIG nuclease family protein n=1 Tax=Hyunsoonleella sp. 2307UL5-6 TaxID=3384768 RepID=UPI0039BD792D